MKIDYFVEETPLGNADALFRLRDKIGVEPFLLLNADVTNQPVIAREEVSWDELNEKHRKMQTLLGRDGAYLDGIYICPHHPDKGFAGERPEYKIACDCRKPKPGLLLKAAKDFNIDLAQSYMIGDDARDVEAGQNAGVRDSLMVETNKENGLLSLITKLLK